MINELLSDTKKEPGINGYVQCCLYDHEFFMTVLIYIKIRARFRIVKASRFKNQVRYERNIGFLVVIQFNLLRVV